MLRNLDEADRDAFEGDLVAPWDWGCFGPYVGGAAGVQGRPMRMLESMTLGGEVVIVDG
jgi:hypothetical protein